MSAPMLADSGSDDKAHQKVVALLTEALKLLDSSEAPPEIAARLQEIIDVLQAAQEL